MLLKKDDVTSRKDLLVRREVDLRSANVLQSAIKSSEHLHFS